MIALNPQFASLLVALTTSAVGAMPTSVSFSQRGEHNARLVLDVGLPPIDIDVHANLRARSVEASHHLERKDEQTIAVYVAPPRSGKPDAKRAPIYGPSSGRTRRNLEDSIDSLDSNSDDNEADFSVAQLEGLSKRSIYKVQSEYGPGLIITPLNSHQLSTLVERGLLDSLLPILGSLPGVGGIISLIGDTLKSVLGGLPIVGPILGNLLLAVHPGVQSADGANGAQFFLDASSSTNATTMYMVDSGRPSQLAMSTLSSDSSANSTTSGERVVSLQMAFINSTSGTIQAFCATYNDAGALAARPCLKDGVKEGPDASQAFGYNPSNGAVRPMWGGDKKEKRDYVVQASEDGQAKQGDKSVVLVFKPFETGNSTTPAAEPSSAPSTSNVAAADLAEEDGKDGEFDPADDAEPAKEEDDVVAQGVPVYIAAAVSSA
ncbi:hypothetical protein BDV93DRAFT_516210 [Ceratobasidium sp. AG-I]|nr:hypothetical protein BDV93DRAFT_516210 [Ceratobasidium sp. AG-I]